MGSLSEAARRLLSLGEHQSFVERGSGFSGQACERVRRRVAASHEKDYSCVVKEIYKGR